MTPESSHRYRFPRRMRISLDRDFQAVFKAKVRKGIGPLLLYAMPNKLEYPRLGLSVSRKIGSAVKRNRIKRLLREAFRIMQYDFPAGYDLVIVVKPHETLTLAEYQRYLFKAVRSLHKLWIDQLTTTPDNPEPPESPEYQSQE